MFWVVQSNLFAEQAFQSLLEQLERQGVDYAIVKYIPFAYDLEPDVNPPGPVWACGCGGLRNVVQKKGWTPGYLDVPLYSAFLSHYGEYALNADAMITKLSDIPNLGLSDDVFLRPNDDSKAFAGTRFKQDVLAQWVKNLVECNKDNTFTTLKADDFVVMSTLKEIWAEYRFYVVDRRVVTGSLYKQSNRVYYKECEDEYIIEFAQLMAANCPVRTCALDVAITPDGLKVIELNALNSAGFYACDMGKYVDAINNMLTDPI